MSESTVTQTHTHTQSVTTVRNSFSTQTPKGEVIYYAFVRKVRETMHYVLVLEMSVMK